MSVIITFTTNVTRGVTLRFPDIPAMSGYQNSRRGDLSTNVDNAPSSTFVVNQVEGPWHMSGTRCTLTGKCPTEERTSMGLGPSKEGA